MESFVQKVVVDHFHSMPLAIDVLVLICERHTIDDELEFVRRRQRAASFDTIRRARVAHSNDEHGRLGVTLIELVDERPVDVNAEQEVQVGADEQVLINGIEGQRLVRASTVKVHRAHHMTSVRGKEYRDDERLLDRSHCDHVRGRAIIDLIKRHRKLILSLVEPFERCETFHYEQRVIY